MSHWDLVVWSRVAISWISCGARSVLRHVQELCTSLRTEYEFFFYEQLEKAVRNGPEIVGTAFVRVFVTRLLQHRAIQLKNSTIIPTAIV